MNVERYSGPCIAIPAHNILLEYSYGVETHFQQYYSFIVEVSFIGGGNRSAWRKPPTCRKSLTNCITQCFIEYTSSERDSNSCVLFQKE